MTNFEIRDAIAVCQRKIQDAVGLQSSTFVINPEFMKLKKQIDSLRQKCTHKNNDDNFETFNGRCVYCGSKL